MKNIVLIGMMGCGKTTIALLLSQELKRPVIDIDEYIEKTYHMTIPEMFDISEEYFREREIKCCADIGKLDGYIISTGGGVIKNHVNIENLKKNGIVIYIDRPVENIYTDIEISSRPLLKDGVEKLKQLYVERHPVYLAECDYHIKNTSSLEDVVEKIQKIL